MGSRSSEARGWWPGQSIERAGRHYEIVRVEGEARPDAPACYAHLVVGSMD